MLWHGLNCSYLMPHRLLGQSFDRWPFFWHPENTFLCSSACSVGRRSCISASFPSECTTVPSSPVVGQAACRRRTCHATCSRFAAGGSIGLLVRLGSPVVVSLLETMGLLIDVVLGAFLIHRQDARLPFGIGARNTEADVRMVRE